MATGQSVDLRCDLVVISPPIGQDWVRMEADPTGVIQGLLKDLWTGQAIKYGQCKKGKGGVFLSV